MADRILPVYKDVGKEQVKEAVFQALGAASVCWESMDGTGTFQSVRATQIGNELLSIIYQARLAAPLPVILRADATDDEHPEDWIS